MDPVSRTVSRALICLAALTIVSLLGWAAPARGHEHVIVGEYELIVGWKVEPAIAGVLNGLDVGIMDHLPNGTTIWVTGAQATLTSTLVYGSASMSPPLEPQFGQPGWYTFDVIPTRSGQYSVHLVGTLNTTTVNVTVDLDPVDAASTVQFPTTDPTASDLNDSIAELRLENAGLRIQNTLATGIGVAGLGVGLVALALVARTRRSGRDHA